MPPRMSRRRDCWRACARPCGHRAAMAKFQPVTCAMKPWYFRNLGDAMLAGEALGDIEARFLAAYVKAGRPPGMALFSRHESEGRLHCEVVLYLSPAAAAVA